MENNYVISINTYTLEEYMETTGLTLWETMQMFGSDAGGFVGVALQDYNIDYFRRVFRGIYADDMLEHMQAVQSATLELLHDYFTYGKK